jgi:hypothetical protein
MLFARLNNKRRLMVREGSLQLIDLLKKEGKVSTEAGKGSVPPVVAKGDSKLAKSNFVVLSAAGKYQPLSGVGKVRKKERKKERKSGKGEGGAVFFFFFSFSELRSKTSS